MSDYLVNISPVPIETIDHVEKFAEAARNLATCNSVYKIPPAVAAHDGGYLVENDHKLQWLIAALDNVSPGWSSFEHPRRTVVPDYDIGMHGNPYEPSMLTPDYLHYHRTAAGTAIVTFARALPAYLEDDAAKERLTAALRQGMTDVRYADPNTFQQTELSPGDVLVFRLSERTGLPFLHDFRTTSEAREVEITVLMHLT
ncbi:MAG TPA: hypothetical protein VFT59_01265 [Candidatus Saccharimonadales bacterium]|nr:hypothetical protein [Candidatus Saccharimonadales bacterium]